MVLCGAEVVLCDAEVVLCWFGVLAMVMQWC